jgi:hypothetical protein
VKAGWLEAMPDRTEEHIFANETGK